MGGGGLRRVLQAFGFLVVGSCLRTDHESAKSACHGQMLATGNTWLPSCKSRSHTYCQVSMHMSNYENHRCTCRQHMLSSSHAPALEQTWATAGSHPTKAPKPASTEVCCSTKRNLVIPSGWAPICTDGTRHVSDLQICCLFWLSLPPSLPPSLGICRATPS